MDKRLFGVPLNEKEEPWNITFDKPVRQLAFDRFDNLWLKYSNGEITKSFESKYKFETQDFNNEMDIPRLNQWDCVNDSLLVSTSSHQFLIFDIKNLKLHYIHRDSLTQPSGIGWTDNFLVRHYILNDSTCLIYNKDITQFNFITHEISKIQVAPNVNPSYERFTSMILDKSGNLWISHAHGLLKAELKDHTIELKKRYDLNEGLTFNFINKLHCDESNRIWAFGFGGIQAIDVTTDEIRYFGLSSGIPESHISGEPLVVLPDRSIAYTDFNNLVHFHPDSLWNSKNDPQVSSCNSRSSS